MDYNYNFSLGSVLFMSLTAIFYLRQKRMRDLQDRLYTVMLFGGLVAVTFDFLAAAVEPVALGLPLWLLYALNMLFVLGEHVCLPAFFLYSLVEVGQYSRMNRTARALTLLPFLCVVCALFLSPFGTRGIFYIDAQHIYRAGASHWLLYAVAGLYMACGCGVLALNYRKIERVKRVLILFFGVVILCAMLFQIYNPRYLLVTSAAALCLTGMYYVMRAPGEQVDPFTGAFCRKMLPAVLRDLREKNKRCTLMLYSVLNGDEIARTHGSQLSDGLLGALSDWLRAAFPGYAVVYMNDAGFAVAVESVLDAGALRALRQKAPATLRVKNVEIPVKLALAALYHGDRSPEKTLPAIDFLFHQMMEEQPEDVFIADAAFEEKYDRVGRLEASMSQIMREGVPQLLLEPVLRAGTAGSPAMLDVSLWLAHPLLRDAAPDEFLLAIRQSGNIRWYYEQLIALTGAKAKETDPGVRFCLPLLGAVLIQDEMATRLFDLVTAAGMDPGRVVLRLLEKDVSGGSPVVVDNIKRLAALGFGFRLDEFAEGYTDISLLSALPIGVIMVDESLLRNARNSARSQALLGCVISILAETGKEVICDGVDAPGDAVAACAAGAPLLHGKWCAHT